jgi:pimeloyl-ACP methyl ester carboxylesterase
MKRTIIILHGWNLSGARFAPLAAEFKKMGHNVFAPDLPGFGKEPPPDQPWHVVDYAEFLKKYIKKHKIKDVILVGHSFGGRVALKFAELYPNDIHAMVLTGTPGFSPIPSKKLVFFLIISKIGGMIFALPVLNILADRARKFLYYVAGAREFLRAEGPMRQTFKYIVKDDLVGSMTSVRIPCLLVWGELDTIVPLSIARRMSETISGAELKIIPQEGHAVPFKQPGLFTSYIKDFLKI